MGWVVEGMRTHGNEIPGCGRHVRSRASCSGAGGRRAVKHTRTQGSRVGDVASGSAGRSSKHAARSCAARSRMPTEGRKSACSSSRRGEKGVKEAEAAGAALWASSSSEAQGRWWTPTSYVATPDVMGRGRARKVLGPPRADGHEGGETVTRECRKRWKGSEAARRIPRGQERHRPRPDRRQCFADPAAGRPSTGLNDET